MRRRLMLAAAAVVALAGPATGQQDGSAIAARAGRTYRALTSIRATFHQSIEDRMIGTQESRGELVQAGSAQLSMRFTDPAGDAIMLDGTYVWVYTPSTTPGQVIRMTIPTDPVYGPNVLARILDKPAERYETTLLRTDVLDGRPVDVVEFMPNGGDPLFRRAVIWLDRETFLPRRLELDELTRVRRTLTLSKIRTNTPVNRKEFAFDVPAGVRVVDR
ncbi:MAG TPA: outer-membrane lipoprotein carrier protein LolA [Gemmatimonadales bacterium]